MRTRLSQLLDNSYHRGPAMSGEKEKKKTSLWTWVGLAGGGVMMGLVAASAQDDIYNDTLLTCIQHNADEGREGIRVKRFCDCVAMATAEESGFLPRFFVALGMNKIDTPHDISATFAEQVATACG